MFQILSHSHAIANKTERFVSFCFCGLRGFCLTSLMMRVLFCVVKLCRLLFVVLAFIGDEDRSLYLRDQADNGIRNYLIKLKIYGGVLLK